MLDTAEIIRDPVHGDILVSALELLVIDTPEMQRMRRLRQLGPTNLVYPGAVHSRFEHAVGTLHMASQMIRTINDNSKVYQTEGALKIEPRNQLLIRLGALLHDIAHVPFSHLLEDEAALFGWRNTGGDAERPQGFKQPGRPNKQWAVPYRSKITLDEETPLRECVVTAIKDEFAALGAERAQSLAEEFYGDLCNLLKASKPEGYPRLPYAVDILGNTVCADLLDYVQRDILFTGLSEALGDRFLRYLVVLPLTREGGVFRIDRERNHATGRCVLMAYHYDRRLRIPGAEGGHVVPSKSALVEAIDLVRKRLSLNEKVYYHRTKRVSSAMIEQAFFDAYPDATYRMSEEFQRKLLKMGDEELMADLKVANAAAGRNLCEGLASRQLYRRVFSGRRIGPGSTEEARLDDLYKRCRDPDGRNATRIELAAKLGIRPSDILIHCPPMLVNNKPVEVLVRQGPKDMILPLKDVEANDLQQEIVSLTTRHEHLWSIDVYLAPDLVLGGPRSRYREGQAKARGQWASAISGEWGVEDRSEPGDRRSEEMPKAIWEAKESFQEQDKERRAVPIAVLQAVFARARRLRRPITAQEYLTEIREEMDRRSASDE